MMENKRFIIDMETENKEGFVSVTNIKKLELFNHKEFPVTPTIIKSTMDIVKKEVRKNSKSYNLNGLTITVYAYGENYQTINLFRYTFFLENGKAILQYRPYENNMYAVQEEKEYTIKKLQTVLTEHIEKLIYQNFTVKEDKDNLLLRNY